MNDWPKSGAEVKAAGYQSSGQGKCRGCKATVVWVETPAGKKMPLSILGSDRWQPHWIDCPARDQFKRKKA